MVRLKKAGPWALAGHREVELERDQVADFGPVDNAALVEAGWAEYVEAAPKADAKPEAQDKSRGPGSGRPHGQRGNAADRQ